MNKTKVIGLIIIFSFIVGPDIVQNSDQIKDSLNEVNPKNFAESSQTNSNRSGSTEDKQRNLTEELISDVDKSLDNEGKQGNLTQQLSDIEKSIDDTYTITNTTETSWDEKKLKIYINDSVEPYKPYNKYVRNATNYWEDIQFFKTYDPEFTLTSNKNNADIIVNVVRDISSCGGSGKKIVGCAPLIKQGLNPPSTANVRIVHNLGKDSAISTLKHEFGHVLGVEHQKLPTFMTATSPITSELEATLEQELKDAEEIKLNKELNNPIDEGEFKDELENFDPGKTAKR